MKLREFDFGVTKSKQKVKGVCISNSSGYSLKVINWGATLISFQAPDRNGISEEITLGFNTFDQYENYSPYFGSTIGRVANRISDGCFVLAGKTYQLEKNEAGISHIHGGNHGLSKVLWDIKSQNGSSNTTIICKYSSKDGEEGYPGNLKIEVRYTLSESNQITIEYKARTDQSCPVNLTNHTYWNLSGACKESILSHQLTLHCDQYLPIDVDMIPTGELQFVEGTPWDFRGSKVIGRDIEKVGGYDHSYVKKMTPGKCELIATVFDPNSGRGMQISTTEPNVQLYTGNFLDQLDEQGFKPYDGLCLETQRFPDAPNHENFPTIVISPEDHYYQKTVYSFN